MVFKVVKIINKSELVSQNADLMVSKVDKIINKTELVSQNADFWSTIDRLHYVSS